MSRKKRAGAKGHKRTLLLSFILGGALLAPPVASLTGADPDNPCTIEGYFLDFTVAASLARHGHEGCVDLNNSPTEGLLPNNPRFFIVRVCFDVKPVELGGGSLLVSVH